MSTLWAFATLAAPPGAPLLDVAAAQLRCAFAALRPSELATAVWALATLRHHPGDAFLDAAVADARARMAAFAPAELASLLWACAELAHMAAAPLAEDALAAARAWVDPNPNPLGAEDVAGLAWAGAVLFAVSPAALGTLRALLAGLPADGFSARALARLMQAGTLPEPCI